MQRYPSGGHTQHCYTGVLEDDDYFTMDDEDYHYNNRFAHQSKQKTLDEGIHHPKQNYKWDNHVKKDSYYGGSTMAMKCNQQWKVPPKNIYKHNNMRSKGWYAQDSDYFKHGHEDYNNAQYSKYLYESDEEYDTWNGENDHFGLGRRHDTDKYPVMSYGVEESGEYVVHQGPHMPMVEQHPSNIHVGRPVWCPKGVKD